MCRTLLTRVRVQLFFKICPLFIVLTCVALLPVPCTSDDWWAQFGWCCVAQIINFAVVVSTYGVGARWYALKQVDCPSPNPTLCSTKEAGGYEMVSLGRGHTGVGGSKAVWRHDARGRSRATNLDF